MKRVIFSLLLCGFFQIVYAQGNRIATEINSTVNFRNLDFLQQDLAGNFSTPASSISEYSKYRIAHNAISEIVDRQDGAIEFPIRFQRHLFKIKLIKNNFLTGHLTFKNQKGKLIPTTDVVNYYGIVEGETQSIVAISFFQNGIEGIVSIGKRNYIISTLESEIPNGISCVFFRETDNPPGVNFICATPFEQQPVPSPAAILNSARTPEKKVRLYFEADYPFYQKCNSSTTNVTTFMTSLLNSITAVFANESITVETLTPVIWTSTDPYPTTTPLSIYTLSASFDSQVGTSFGGDLAHLVSGRACYDASGIGAGSLCGSQRHSVSTRMGYTVPTVFTPMNFEVALVAHELGHTFGSPHTQNCFWNGNNTAIDGCGAIEYSCANPGLPPSGGTIMSYCDNVNLAQGVGIQLSNGFGIQPGNLIRNNVSNAACLTTFNPSCPSSVTIDGTSFIGNYYTVPLTESSGWIKTTNLTKISGGVVRLDADSLSYVELSPGFETTAWDANSVFLAKAYNGCTTGYPARMMATFNSIRAGNTVDEDAKLYPNPVSSYAFLESKEDIVSNSITINDMKGIRKEVLIKIESSHRIKIDVSKLSSGVYFVRYNIVGGVRSTRFVVVH